MSCTCSGDGQDGSSSSGGGSSSNTNTNNTITSITTTTTNTNTTTTITTGPCSQLCSLPELRLRFLCPADLTEVKALCREWFPIEYPDSWYADITSSPQFYALAATLHSRIIGLLVAETKPLNKLNKEDQDILAWPLRGELEVGYILTLGVVDGHRGIGVASLLLHNYLSMLSAPPSPCHGPVVSLGKPPVQAVLLHVLTTNTQAIAFYQRRSFVRHTFLPYYYNIQGKPRDGFTYVRYVNAQCTDYLQHWVSSVSGSEVCWWPVRVMAKFWGLVARSTTAIMAHRLS
ncbi:hypothetical protein Pmani_009149 [Petrolisthes manimaculis]|uniref:N-alpha-acetyltransferase 60 n=1 Tax=Petrolisthes manimaculis TaxID=1843537 RepID=A0AAE1Q7I7_9EUCA|nr:hypothetical protein Pmani_009149 [Petrolisthes manimaculis]